MTNKLILLVLILTVSLNALEQKQEGVGWLDIFAYDENTKKERVLLIGDSIVRQNTNTIRQGIKDKYVLTRLSTSKSICSKSYLQQIRIALDVEYSIILVNNGLHDFISSDDKYKDCYVSLLDLLQREQPDSKILLMATTGVNGIIKRNNIVKNRNVVLKELSKEYKMDYLDLYSIIENKKQYFRDPYHHTRGG